MAHSGKLTTHGPGTAPLPGGLGPHPRPADAPPPRLRRRRGGGVGLGGRTILEDS